MIRKILFPAVLVATASILLIASFSKRDGSFAIIAEVEPQKTAISFHKPVRIKKLFVAPGQKVKVGDSLLVVERPDLELDLKNALKELEILKKKEVQVEIDTKSKLKETKLKHRLKIAELENRLEKTKFELEQESNVNSQILKQLAKDSLDFLSELKAGIELIEEQIELEKNIFIEETNAVRTSRNDELAVLALEIEKVQLELQSLEEEKQQLVQIAQINGTVGSISTQLFELVPSFKTIISLYDTSPTLIKAYVNEESDLEVMIGTKVSVKSISREYLIEGEIVEIGSRIISYPNQMIQGNQMKMWGKEIFIKIPENNEFLNGERVYVILNAQ
jgi:HlyD family secretion protein